MATVQHGNPAQITNDNLVVGGTARDAAGDDFAQLAGYAVKREKAGRQGVVNLPYLGTLLE